MPSKHKNKLALESLEKRRVLSANGVTPLADSIEVTNTEAPEVIVGDIDGNGHCGFEDFLIMAKNMGKNGANSGMGDLDGDGTVAFSDFLMLAKNFNRGKAADAPRGKPDDVPRGPKTDEVSDETDADQESDAGEQAEVTGRPADVPRGPKGDQPTGRPADVPRGPKEDAEDDEEVDESGDDEVGDDTEESDEGHGRPADVPRGPKGDQPTGRPADVPRGPKEDAEDDEEVDESGDDEVGDDTEESDEGHGRPADVPRGPKGDQPTGRPADVPRGPKEDAVVESPSKANVEVVVNGDTIEITSDKGIGNIVYAVDAVFTKIDDLDGLQFTLEVDGITDVWVKSGSNASGDGPGYGEHFTIG